MMASATNFEYIERPKSKEYCRFCNEAYQISRNGSKQCRFNLFENKRNKNKITLQERLSDVNINVEKDPSLSDTICQKCKDKIKKLEDAKAVRDEWRGVKRKSNALEGEEDAEGCRKKSKTEIEQVC